MPTPPRIAAQVTVDAEPERVWRAAPAAALGISSSLRRFTRLFAPA